MIAMTMPAQSFPKTGPLAKHLNESLSDVKRSLRAESATVYCYVVRTIEFDGAEFVQTGSAPNFEGGVITLCTCKHRMRSHRSREDWPGTWVAGFSSVGKVPGPHVNHLVYLMKVKSAFASHKELWNALPTAAARAKAADVARLGDVFQPKVMSGDWFAVASYQPPRSDHSHCADHSWPKDIHGDGLRPPLLLGDPEHSYLWSVPKIGWTPPQIPRNYQKHSMDGFVSRLIHG